MVQAKQECAAERVRACLCSGASAPGPAHRPLPHGLAIQQPARRRDRLLRFVLGSSDVDVALGLRISCASSIRAAGPSGRPLSHVLAGRASGRGAELPRDPRRFVCDRVCALDFRSLAGGRRTRPPQRRLGLAVPVGQGSCPLLTSAARGPRTSAGSASAFAASGPSPGGAVPFVPVIRHLPGCPPVSLLFVSCFTQRLVRSASP